MEQPENRNELERWLDLIDGVREENISRWLTIVLGCFILGFGVFLRVIDAGQESLSYDLLALAIGTMGIMHILRGVAGLLYQVRPRFAMALHLFGALALIAALVLLPASFYLRFGPLGAAIVLALGVGGIVLGALYNRRRMQQG